MSTDPPVTPDAVSSLDSSARSTSGPVAVGGTVLPCQAWKLLVVVESTVPFHPEGSVGVHKNITGGGIGYSTEWTRMDGPRSPEVQFSGGGRFTFSMSASADKWEAAGSKSVSVSPRVEPFTETLKIKPKKPWVVFEVRNVLDDKLLPKFVFELALGTNKRTATSADGKPTSLMELETATPDGQFSLVGNARDFELPKLEHPDEVWEFVSLASA